jgi:hypothetical protein
MPPRTGQEIRGFLGVNLRKERVSLADEELAHAINCDLHTQPGAILLRLGRQAQFLTALDDLAIRRLAKINGHRYQVAGQTVYRDTVSILSGLSSNLFTTLHAFRPLNDTTTWAFIADDVRMRKDDGETVHTWGITAASVVPVTQIGATGDELTGAYRAAYTRVRFEDDAVAHESNLSTITAALTLTAQRLTIGDMTASDEQINGLGIYHTVAGGGALLLDERVAIPTDGTTYSVTHTWEAALDPGELSFQWSYPVSVTQRGSQTWEADTTTTTAAEDVDGYRVTQLWETEGYVTTQVKRWAYSSTTADAALGEEAEDDNDEPPVASWITEYQGHAFLTRDAEHPHYLWWSKRFRPESWPADQFLEIGNPDDPLQCALPMAGLLGVFSRLTKYRVTGNATAGFVAQETLSRRGTPAGQAVIASERGLIFVARDGVYVTNLLSADDELSEAIAPIFWGESVNGIDAVNWDAASTMAAALWKGRYYLALPTGTATTPDVLAVFSTTTKRWYFYDHPCRSLFNEEDTDDLLAGFTDGLVYVLEDGTSDGGDAVALDASTKDYVGGSSETRKLFLWARVDLDTLGEEVTVDLYVDGVLKRSPAVTSSRGKALIAFPGGSLGYSWRLRFRYTGTTRVRVYGAAAIWAPLEAA